MAGEIQRKLKSHGFRGGGAKEDFQAEVSSSRVLRKTRVISWDLHHAPVRLVLLSPFNKWVSCISERMKDLP